MPFQSTVFLKAAAGVPGDRYNDSPWRAQSFILKSVDPAFNIIGATAYTVSAEGEAVAGATGTLGYAGVLVNSKVYATSGTTAGGTLAATLVLPNETQAEITTMGSYFVELPGAAAIGDHVIFDDVTGALETLAQGSPLPVGKTFAFAEVDFFTVAAAGLGVITLSPTLVIPV